MSLPEPRATIDEHGIATLTIEGSKSMNIIGTPAILALTEALNRLREDPAVRVLVLRGRDDRAFIGGADIAEMVNLTPPTAEAFITRLKNLCEAVYRFPTPVIGRLAGWSLGGGLEVAMACDLRLASDEAVFGMPEVKVGIPSVIHAALMPRLMGPTAAGWMLLTGENIDAATALAQGLVHRVCPLAELDTLVHGTALKLAALGPQVLRQQKALLHDWQQRPLAEAIDRTVPEFGRAFGTGEPQLHMGRFLNRKRDR